MSADLAARVGPSEFQSLPRATKRTKPFYYYAVIALLALIVGGAFLLWLNAHTALLKNTTSPPASDTRNKNEPKKNPEVSSDWIFVVQADDGRIKVYYLRQGKTFKLKFTNDDATAEIRYKVRAEEKFKGQWESEPWHEATVTVKKGEQQLDNWPLGETEEIRNVEVEIIDWNYK